MFGGHTENGLDDARFVVHFAKRALDLFDAAVAPLVVVVLDGERLRGAQLVDLFAAVWNGLPLFGHGIVGAMARPHTLERPQALQRIGDVLLVHRLHVVDRR